MLSETRTRQNSLANVCVKGGQEEYKKKKKKKERRRSKKKEEEEEERMQKVERSEASTYVV